MKRRLDWSAMTHRNSAKRWILAAAAGVHRFVRTACCGSAFEPYRSFSGGAADISLAQGIMYFSAALPIAFGGLFSGIAQARAVAAGVGIVAKSPMKAVRQLLWRLWWKHMQSSRCLFQFDNI